MNKKKTTTTSTFNEEDDDNWLRSAITDASVVADLLLRLKQHSDSSSYQSHPSFSRIERNSTSSPAVTSSFVSSFPLWGKRQPRSSGPTPTPTTDAVTVTVTVSVSKKESDPDPNRWSPTTPLSWCGGASSGGGDGFEETSGPSDPVGLGGGGRSKELATLRVPHQEQKSLNQSLKRMKIDPHTQSAAECGSTISQSVAQSSITSPAYVPKQVIQNYHPMRESHQADDDPGDQKPAAFVLPDLNMMPEEDFGL